MSTQVEQSEEDRDFGSDAWLALLEDGQEQQFDDLAELCAASCGTPISVISLVGRDAAHILGAVGLEIDSVPLGDCLCAHTVLQDDLLIVPNALVDPRFMHNPFVTGEPHLRFYAAAALFSGDGQRIGALCVADTIPRVLKPREAYALRLIARQVNALLELRMCRHQVKLATESLRHSEALLQTLADTVPAPCYLKHRDGRLHFYNQQFADTFHIAPGSWLQKDCTAMLPSTVRDQLAVIADEAFALGTTTRRTVDVELCAGGIMQWEMHQTPCTAGQGEALLAVVAMQIHPPAVAAVPGIASTAAAPMH